MKDLKEALTAVDKVYESYKPVHAELVKHQADLVVASEEAYKVGLELLTGVKVVDSACIAVVNCSENPRNVLRKLQNEFKDFEKLGTHEITNVIFDPRKFTISIYATTKEHDEQS